MIITVDSKSIKQAFQDISPILKKSETSKSIAFTVEENSLYITAEAGGVLYQSHMEIKSSIDYVETTLTVWYSAIEEFLSSRGEVEIEISPVSVSITTEGFYKSLVASNSVISKFSTSKIEGTNFDTDKLEFSIKKLTSSTTLQKTLQMDKPLLFFGDYALLKYPIFYIKVRSSGLHTSMSVEHAKCIVNFKPTNIQEREVLEFRRDNAILIIPKNSIEDDKSFESIVNSIPVLTRISTDGIFTTLQKISRAVGPEQCRCYIYEQGLEIEVNKPTSKLSKKINCSGKQLTSFNIPIEYLLLAFNLLGDLNVEVLAGGGKVCLRNNLISMLISVA